jgi:hypothetical protein
MTQYIGLKACLTCGFTQRDAVPAAAAQPAYAHLPVPPSMYPAPVQTPSAPQSSTTPAAPAASEPKHRRYRLAAAGLAVLVLITVGGTFGYGETAAHAALKTAHTQLADGQYQAAYDTLHEVNQSITLGGTKKQLRSGLVQSERWIYQQSMLAQAKALVQAGKYHEGLEILAMINRDFPGYDQVIRYQRQANARIAQAQVAEAAAQAAAAASSVVTAQPAPAPTPSYRPAAKPKPKATPAPAPTPTPQPAQPATPAPQPAQPVVVTPDPTPPNGTD